jgi:hypothetical protein
MFHHSSLIDRLVLVSVAALMLGSTLVEDARGWQHPATPCPCAADGVCRPNGPWGHTPTKWRPWPGDTLGREETSAEETETRKEFPLPDHELPPITKEGLRGPDIVKPPRPKREESEAAEPAIAQPQADPLEGVDPLGIGGQEDFNLEPPVEDPLQPAIEPQPGIDLLEEGPEAEPEANPLEEFDPFSQLNVPRGTPASASRRTSLAPAAGNDAPPQLPPSLRKLSQRVVPSRKIDPRDSRFRRPAMALVQ